MGALTDRLVAASAIEPRSFAEPEQPAARPELERQPVADVVSLRNYAAAKITTSAAGVDGNAYSDYEGALAGGADLNPIWSGRGKYDVIEEMRKSDPAAHSLLWMFKLPIRQAEHSVEPYRQGKDPVDLLIAEATKAQFGLNDYEGWLDLTYDELIAQDLLMLDFGAMFEEITWGDAVQWRPLDAGADAPRLIRPIARLAPRYPATVYEIETDARTGRIKRLEQDSPGAQPIDGERIVAHVLDREGSWFGTSLLRYCYGAWLMKKSLMISSAIGWDRYAAGTPVVRYPQGQPGAKAEAEAIGRAYRTHERAYIALEGPPPPVGGWGFEIENGAATLADPINLLRHHDGQIAHAGLQGFKELGNTATGSRATADVTQDPYWKAVTSIAMQGAATRRRQAVRRFVDVNFGKAFNTPELRVAKITAEDMLALSQVLANLSSAGLTFTDRGTQNDIRDRIELNHLPDDVAGPLGTALDGLPEDVGVAGVPAEGDSIAPPVTA